MLDRVDALILAGGSDVDPASYGAEPASGDERHLARARPVRARAGARGRSSGGMPVLGICRGMQILNVARGGTLVQHLPDLLGHERPPPHARRLRRPRGAARAGLARGPRGRRASG